MLEQRSLLLTASNAIVDPDSARFLGQASYHRRGEGWFGWLRGETIRVYETEDDSLVMTVSRPWMFARTWEVRDAEERRVGIVYRGGLWDARGERLFAIHEGPARGSLRFQDTAGREAATAQRRDGSEIVLTFREVSEGDPFARMTILAKTLLWRNY